MDWDYKECMPDWQRIVFRTVINYEIKDGGHVFKGKQDEEAMQILVKELQYRVDNE